MTIMIKTASSNDVQKERTIRLPRASYEALSARRLEISSLVSAHIIWDNEEAGIVILGSEASVHQTASILSQCLVTSATPGAAPRKLVGRSLHTLNSLNNPASAAHHTQPHSSLEDAKQLLLMSQLPPGLSISGGRGLPQFPGLGHSPLGRTVSDSLTKLTPASDPASSAGDPLASLSRRKLESEDSSYDSDHEALTGSLSQELPLTAGPQLSKSHDDVSRTYSETLAQEFSEYVSLAPSFTTDSFLHNVSQPHSLIHAGQVSPRSGIISRELSPVERSASNRLAQDPVQSARTELESVDKDQYYQKVEFALKLGYAEELTRRALDKIGFSACNDDLLNELIRLQQSKVVDPKDLLLKETCDSLVQATLLTPSEQSSLSRSVSGAGEVPNLRPIVIDGSNVAMAHGKDVFSCRGIEICVNWFKARGHTDIKVFLPAWRKESSKPDNPKTGGAILEKLEKDNVLAYTPSRQVLGKRIQCHDDRYILNLAVDNGAVIVSNDHYRELITVKKEYKKVIEESILMYTFVDDKFMPPDDPYGRNGPTLDNLLKMSTSFTAGAGGSVQQPCPYGKKCTYGNKCKFYHAERGNVPMKTVTDKLKEQSKRQIQEVRTRNTSRDSSPGELHRAKSMNLPLRRTESDMAAFSRKPQQVSRTLSSRPQYPTKNEVSKSKSVDNSGRFHRDLRMASVPISSEEAGASGWAGLEMGCLSNYGQPPPPAAWTASQQFGSLLHQPPPPQHRKLERQLTINPAFDPRINKAEKLSPSHQPVLSSEAMEYMHRNPPPPFGLVNIAETSELAHQNVTRNASAPDSIKHWDQVMGQTMEAVRLSVASPGPGAQPDQASPLQRHSSGSDTQLNRGTPVNKTFSSSAAEPWTFSNQFDTGMSPLLGTSIWSAPGPAASSPSLASPPVSPSRHLGPVGSSRPGLTAALEAGDRAQQFSHLCNIFPRAQVEAVMTLLPHEKDTAVLCKKIVDLYT